MMARAKEKETDEEREAREEQEEQADREKRRGGIEGGGVSPAHEAFMKQQKRDEEWKARGIVTVQEMRGDFANEIAAWEGLSDEEKENRRLDAERTAEIKANEAAAEARKREVLEDTWREELEEREAKQDELDGPKIEAIAEVARTLLALKYPDGVGNEAQVKQAMQSAQEAVGGSARQTSKATEIIMNEHPDVDKETGEKAEGEKVDTLGPNFPDAERMRMAREPLAGSENEADRALATKIADAQPRGLPRRGDEAPLPSALPGSNEWAEQKMVEEAEKQPRGLPPKAEGAAAAGAEEENFPDAAEYEEDPEGEGEWVEVGDDAEAKRGRGRPKGRGKK